MYRIASKYALMMAHQKIANIETHKVYRGDVWKIMHVTEYILGKRYEKLWGYAFTPHGVMWCFTSYIPTGECRYNYFWIVSHRVPRYSQNTLDEVGGHFWPNMILY